MVIATTGMHAYGAMTAVHDCRTTPQLAIAAIQKAIFFFFWKIPVKGYIALQIFAIPSHVLTLLGTSSKAYRVSIT